MSLSIWKFVLALLARRSRKPLRVGMNFKNQIMEKLKILGRRLTRDEMKKINGGNGTMSFVCTCSGSTWLSDCTTSFCFQQQANSHCGYGSGVSCKSIVEP